MEVVPFEQLDTSIRAPVVVLGAGAAGLACAARLSAAGVDSVVLDARGRIGGRVHSLSLPDAPVAVELGAEFVHELTPMVQALAARARTALVRVTGDRWQSWESRWQRVPDFEYLMRPVLAALPSESEEDVSFAGALARARHVQPRARMITTGYVEGFNAADAGEVSARWIRRQESADGGTSFRLVGGWGTLVDVLAADATRARAILGVAARAVEWSAGNVRVRFAPASASGGSDRDAERVVEARALVWTLPLGVWALPDDAPGAVRVTPAPDGKRDALGRVRMGHAQRMVLRFREPFWRTGAARELAVGASLDELSFVHSSDDRYNVFWTPAPVELPWLTAWIGGPRARALAGLPHEIRLAHALSAVARTFGEPRERLAALLVESHAHDWSADPWSRGAYAYPLVGGADAARELARPVGDTLFYAGEATHTGHASGTVHGAIETGQRAADEVLATLHD